MSCEGEPSLEGRPSRECRDELNLAEFPLACLGDRPPRGVATLRFSDRVFDRGANEWVEREVIITGAEEYGLPVAKDEELLVGLLALTSRQGFVSRRVDFTKRRLLALIAWGDSGKDYRRLEQGFDRLASMSVKWKNAWWSRREKCWMTKRFSLLDNIDIPEGRASGVGSFAWNEVLFDSFQSGNVKALDMELYTSLKSSLTKRLYRFLDKRFGMKRTWDFDMLEVGHEHLGIKKGTRPSYVKQKLNACLNELADCAYLASSDWFAKKNGRWQLTVVRGDNGSRGTDARLVSQLTERGVSVGRARRLARTHSSSAITERLPWFDWLVAKGGEEAPRNPGGFLADAIDHGWAAPPEYKEKRESQQRLGIVKKARDEKVSTAEAEAEAVRRGLLAHIASLDLKGLAAFDEEARSHTSKGLRAKYDELKPSGGKAFEDIERYIREQYFGDKNANPAQAA